MTEARPSLIPPIWFSSRGQIVQVVIAGAALAFATRSGWRSMLSSQYLSSGAVVFYLLVGLVLYQITRLVSALWHTRGSGATTLRRPATLPLVPTGIRSEPSRLGGSAPTVPTGEPPSKAGGYKARSVDLAVGEWIPEIPPGGSCRVTFSLRRSFQPVVRIVITVEGGLTTEIVGADLRDVAGAYFRAPTSLGRHAFSVCAFAANEASSWSTQPMHVNVVR